MKKRKKKKNHRQCVLLNKVGEWNERIELELGWEMHC